MPRVLVIEDERKILRGLERGLQAEGYEVTSAATGDEGYGLAAGEPFDCLVLELLLPGRDGLRILADLRRAGNRVPVLILTARDAVEDRVVGLDAGADDYLVKPFAFVELQARINALARRPPPQEVVTVLQVGDLRMDLLKRTVTRASMRIDLQPREFQLLEFMMRHAGQSVTRTMLLEKVWEYHFDPQTNVIDVHISRLRSKIDKGFDRPMLQTVRGAGYRLDA